MEKLQGYSGKELRIDLSTGDIETRGLDASLMRKFIGGSGYSAYVLYNEMKKGVDPLGPDNMLVFASGPLTHNNVPGGGSFTVCFKSPAGVWGEARCGGAFGFAMKKAGFDFIIIKGCSDKPVYLEVVNGEAFIRDAANLKGKDVFEKTEILEQSVKGDKIKKVETVCIGPGGENLVKYAAIMSGDRTAGRCGGGTIMGSKNLLGIVAGGSAEIDIYDPEGFKKIAKETTKAVVENEVRDGFNEFGTMGDYPANDEDGDVPTKNYRSNSFGNGAGFLDYFQENNLVKPKGCYPGCPVGCGRVVEVKDGKYKTPVHEGGEYETVGAFTSFVMNEDVDLAVHCGYLCNKYGVDTISCGSAIAFAMECYENGIITVEDTGGVPFEWGSPAAILHGIEIIANRRNIGGILAEGVKIAAQKLGKGSEKFAVHIKGLEGPVHDPRSGKMLGITYGTSNRGMCHIHPFEGMAYDRGKMDWGMMNHGVRDPETLDRWDEKGKGADCKILQDGLSTPDILATCKFLMYTGVTIDDWAAIVAKLTGWDFDGKELLTVGERVYNLQRLFNMREGLSRDDDIPPARIFSPPEFGIYENNQECVIKDFDALLDEYYDARGWDKKTGHPSPEKLEELGL